ncbi:hypothetical protein VNO77_30454 [Canavalia gladiata]|uniref:Uncharacterized protein n=1 Tax=Canavalia gladiata TaxID=3824 RepID=A0AAN9Q393_CANGL
MIESISNPLELQFQRNFLHASPINSAPTQCSSCFKNQSDKSLSVKIRIGAPKNPLIAYHIIVFIFPSLQV